MSEELTAEAAWSQVLDECRKQFTKQTVSNWFKKSKALCLGDDFLKVELKTTFTAVHVKRNYQERIDKITSEVMGRKFTVEFVSSKDSKQSQMGFWDEPVKAESEAEEDNTQVKEDQTAESSGIDEEKEPGVSKIYIGRLNPRYTFDNFVVGNSSQFAHAAAMSVSEQPGKRYNPLFIYGGVGLGKTHLMQAVGHALQNKTRKRGLKICYISGETFTNNLIGSIQSGKMEDFRNRYRKMDVLLIDDIEFIAEKERTQEEFFHTFNALDERQKQIILTSDRPPREIEHLEERLRSRFHSGVIADIQPPELETRIAILRKKSEYSKLIVPDKVLELIAENIRSNVRRLEGSLNSLKLFSTTHKTDINLEIAERVLKNIFENEVKHISVESITKEVCKQFGVTQDALRSQKKTRAVSEPRHVAMYLCQRLTALSTTEIAGVFKRKDHTTVLHARKKITRRLEENLEFEGKINGIIDTLKNIPRANRTFEKQRE